MPTVCQGCTNGNLKHCIKINMGMPWGGMNSSYSFLNENKKLGRNFCFIAGNFNLDP